MNTGMTLNTTASPHPLAALNTDYISTDRRFFSAGQSIVHVDRSMQDVFVVEQGQVVVTRNQQAIDLIEAGEPLFTELYPDAEIVARTRCVLTPPAVSLAQHSWLR